MKKLLLLLMLGMLSGPALYGQIRLPKILKKRKIRLPKKANLAEAGIQKQVRKFNKKSAVSTSFDDAIYEAAALGDFEPASSAYRPLASQPKAASGGFQLKSGYYRMDAKSFCLRAGTHGPSQGDGHLYAPLKGRKAEFVQRILERYGENPGIPQQKIQVLLWAIVAGADMDKLNEKHQQTLNELFSFQELAKYKGKAWVNGLASDQLNEWRQKAMGNISPHLQRIVDAENKIRSMVTQNKAYREIEKVAVLAGVAPPEDQIRRVSRGRWSYHPKGFFVRFFPQGYKRTRVEVYVPHQESVAFATDGQVTGVNENKAEVKEVIFNPSEVVAAPANRSSQRIGVSPVPTKPDENYKIVFHAYGPLTKYKDKNGEEQTSVPGHIFLSYYKDGQLQQVKGFSPIFWENITDDQPGSVNSQTDESYLLPYADDEFPVAVSKEQYEKALAINKNGWLAGWDDCVSYADDVADLIGLNTPILVLDPLDYSFPITYLWHLKRRN